MADDIDLIRCVCFAGSESLEKLWTVLEGCVAPGGYIEYLQQGLAENVPLARLKD
jgi:hypothetical protein